MTDETAYVQGGNAAAAARSVLSSRLRPADPGSPMLDVLLDLAAPLSVELAAERASDTIVSPSPATPSAMPPPPALERAVANVQLPVLPQAALELQRVIQDPKSSSADVARVVSLDPSLATILLHLVNSALYSFPMRIDTVSRAVTVIGALQVYTLSMGGLVLNLAQRIPPKGLDHEAFWLHSVAVAVLAQDLGRLAGLPNPERCFVSGLLHDIGRLALYSTLPEHAQAAADTARTRGLLSQEAERAVLGYDHARVGGMLLRKWDLPYTITSAVSHHHAPDNAESAVLHLADVAARLLLADPADISPLPAPLAGALDHLPPEPEALRLALEGFEERVEAAVGVLLHT